MNELGGRTALITGAAHGIGKTTAARFLRVGANVAVADINGDGAEQAALYLGERAVGYQLDITDDLAVEGTVARVAGHFGSLDILINNAAITGNPGHPRADRVLDIAVPDWRRMIDVNLTGAFICAKYAGLEMVRRGRGGTIVNVASIQGVLATRGLADYATAKAGIIMLTRALAGELSDFGIRVNAVAPGPIDVQRLDPGRPPSATDATLLKRVGLPEEVAEAVFFLTSDLGSFIDGEVLMVDGGAGVCFREPPQFGTRPLNEQGDLHV